MPGAVAAADGSMPRCFAISQLLSPCGCGPRDPGGCCGCSTTTKWSLTVDDLHDGQGSFANSSGLSGEHVLYHGVDAAATTSGEGMEFAWGTGGSGSVRGRGGGARAVASRVEMEAHSRRAGCCATTRAWIVRNLLQAPVSGTQGCQLWSLHLFLGLHSSLYALSIASYALVDQKDQRNHAQTMLGLTTSLIATAVGHLLICYAQCLHASAVVGPEAAWHVHRAIVARGQRRTIAGWPVGAASASRRAINAASSLVSRPAASARAMPVSDVLWAGVLQALAGVSHRAAWNSEDGRAASVLFPDEYGRGLVAGMDSLYSPLAPSEGNPESRRWSALGGGMAADGLGFSIAEEPHDDAESTPTFLHGLDGPPDSARVAGVMTEEAALQAVRPSCCTGALCCGVGCCGCSTIAPCGCGEPLAIEAIRGDAYALEHLALNGARSNAEPMDRVEICCRRLTLARPSSRNLTGWHGILHTVLLFVCVGWYAVWLSGTLALAILDSHPFGSWPGSSG